MVLQAGANCAFYQIKIGPEDEWKTVFVTRYGLSEFACIGFGLCTTVSRVRNLVLPGLTWNIVLAFLDDALVINKDFEDHLDNLRTVFTRFQELDLKVKPKKYAFFRRRVEFLGRQVSPQVVEMALPRFLCADRPGLGGSPFC